MYGLARNSGISRLDSYAEALKHFQTTTIIRGRGEGSRKPLGHRGRVDHYSMELKQSEQSEQPDVVCYLYGYPQVTYHADDTLTIHYPQYGAITAGLYVGELVGIGATQQYSRFVLSVHGAVDTPEENRLGDYSVPKAGLRLKYKTHTTYNRTLLHIVPDNSKPTNTVHLLKGRGRELKSVMVQYQSALNYVYGMFKLREGTFEHSEYEVFGKEVLTYIDANGKEVEYVRIKSPSCPFNEYEKVEQLFEYLMGEEPDDNYKAMLTLSHNMSWSNKRSIKSLEAIIKKYIIARHRDYVLEEVSVPVGTIRKDTYGWCFKGR